MPFSGRCLVHFNVAVGVGGALGLEWNQGLLVQACVL